jgi:4-amino-4-deoxy-L-arabinose transferase-like glycosyltransferase
MDDGNLEPRRAALAFAALSILSLSTTFVWLRLDRSPPTWDDGYYLTNSLTLFDALAEGGLAGYASKFLTGMRTKPPLIAALPTPVYLIAGRHARAAYAINFVFLLVIFATLYRMGRIYSSSRAGLLAVYIAGTMPIVYGLSRWFLVECGLMAIVCAAMWILAEWNEFAGAWKGFLLGAACGLGLLMKTSFPVYVVIPLLYFAIRERRTMLCRSTLAAFTGTVVVLAAPWYALNYRRALETAVASGSSEMAKLYRTGDVFSVADIFRYLTDLLNAGPTLYFVALLLLLPVAGIARPAVRRGLVLCALWGSPILLLTFGHYRELRYAAPLFPALALALGVLIDAAIGRRVAAIAAIAYGLLSLPLLSMLQTSFGILGRTQVELGGLLFRPPRFSYARPYDPIGWPHGEILADIYRSGKFTGGERKTLLVGTDSVRFNADNFALAAAKGRLPFDVSTTAYERDPNAIVPLVDSTAYFVCREGGEPVAPFFNIQGEAALKEVRESGRFTELPIARKLPDGGVAHVFENGSPGRLIATGSFTRAGADQIAHYDVIFAGKLQLTGLSLQHTSEGLEVKYRWRCLKPVDRDYWCFTHILDERDNIVGYLDHAILNGEPPMPIWKVGDVAMERLVFRIPGTPLPGPYRLRLGLFHKDSAQRLPISSSTFPLTDNRTAAIAAIDR